MSNIDFSKVIEMAEESLTNTYVKGEHIKARCPFCGDSKTKPKARRLTIDYYSPYDTYIAKCFRCGESSNIISLYSYLYDVSYTDAKKVLENKIYEPEKIKKIKYDLPKQKSSNEEDKVDKSTEIDINIDRECYSIEDQPGNRQDKRLVEYLRQFQEDRKIDGCFISHSGRYKGRVIIPIYYNDKLVYFQGRSIFDEVVPKYLNPPVDKEDIVVNEDKFDSNRSIVFTEGLIDAFMVGNQGTTSLGVSLNYDFISYLLRKTKQNVIIALDSHYKDKASLGQLKKISEDPVYNLPRVRYFLFPKEYKDYKDLNDLVRDNVISKDQVFDFVISNSVSYDKMKVVTSFS